MENRLENMIKGKKIALHNLGCKVNSYELDVIQQNLVEQGGEIVPFQAEADIYIVNTCTVTNMSDKKSRQILRRAKIIKPAKTSEQRIPTVLLAFLNVVSFLKYL